MAPAQEAPPRFKVEDKEYDVLNLDELEFGEIELIEDAFDLPVEKIDFTRAKAVRWLIFVSMRREDPSVAFEDLQSIRYSSFSDVEEEKPKAKGRPTKPKAGE